MDDGIYQIVRDPNTIEDYGPELVLEDDPLGVTVNEFDAGHSSGSVWRDQRHGFNFQAHPPPNSKINKIEVYVDFYGKDGCFWGQPADIYHGLDWVFHAHDSLEGAYWPWLGEPEFDIYGIHWYHPTTPPTGCLLTPFVCVDGVFYWGDPVSLGSDYTTKISISYSWPLNPATNAAWELAPDSDVFYGVKATTPNTDTCGTYLIDGCYSKIYYNEPIIEPNVSYKKINAIQDTEVLTQYTQAPIKADNLYFRMPFRNFLPDRTELALIKNGVMVWKGLSWNSNEVHGQEVEVLAKSQQILLDYRIIGLEYLHYSALTYTIAEMLSDDAPLDMILAGSDTYVWYIGTYPNNYSYRYHPRTITGIYNVGLFYFMNSWKGLFGSDFYAFNPAAIGGVSVFTIEDNTWPLSTLVDHQVDTFIRPGTNDLGAYHFSTLPDLRGIASNVLSDLFTKLGQEVRYRYEMDGNVYQDAAIEIASGSATNPLMRFVDGQDNCRIIKRIPNEPSPSAAIGLGNNPKVATHWKKATTWLSKIFSSSRTGPELQEYLEAQLDDDTTSYEITCLESIWHMRTGDYITAELPDEGPKTVRIRQISTRHNKTVISAGRKLTSLNEQFGILRDAKYAGHTSTKIISATIATNNECATSTTFTVTSGNLAAGGWKCKVTISWNFVLRELVYINGNGGEEDNWASICSNTSPFPPEAYAQVSGDLTAYGYHVYEFYITQNMTAVGVEPYGSNDVEIITPGKYKWRKDGGEWSASIQGYDVWHPTGDYNADLGDGLWGRVIFSCVPGGNPWMIPKTTNIGDKSAYAHCVQTMDLSDIHKFLVLKIDGKVIPPGRYSAIGNSGSLEVDITEFCNVAGSYTLTSELINGLKKSTSPQFYYALSGSIDQSKYVVALEA